MTTTEVIGRLQTLPVLMCGFRPFFLLTAASAPLLMLPWLLSWHGVWVPGMPGGALAWHGHELIFGMISAAIAGFALTAVPEFTQTRFITQRPLLVLVLLWVLARLGYALAGFWPAMPGLWPAALCNSLFWLGLLWQLGPSLWRDNGRKHISFLLSMSSLALLQAGFFIAVFTQQDPLIWLRAATGIVMMLIIVATSRVSMVVMNGLIEEGKPGQPTTPPTIPYLARPPRRNLAIFAIGTCTLCEFALGYDLITGWTALAAMAAMFNLLNDWHIGRMLFTRWALMLYGSYWLIALGYGLMAAAWLGAGVMPSAGRHLLMAGAMGLSVMAIMALVGRIHTGRWLDYRPWLPLAALALVLAAALRAMAGVMPLMNWMQPLLLLAGILWAGCFCVYLLRAWPVLAGPRDDDQSGCAEPHRQGQAPHSGCRH
ncbi:MAG: NnrS family protein [Oceanisphaera sp.]